MSDIRNTELSVIPVLTIPDPVLRQRCDPITQDDFESLRTREWADTLVAAIGQTTGIGLAGPQVGISKRIIVVQIPEDFGYPGFGHIPPFALHVLVSPEVVWLSRDEVKLRERCLSVPGYMTEIVRPRAAQITATTPDGNVIEIESDGLLARLLQHECDHLEGVIHTDRVTRLRDIMKVEPVKADDPILAANAHLYAPVPPS